MVIADGRFAPSFLPLGARLQFPESGRVLFPHPQPPHKSQDLEPC